MNSFLIFLNVSMTAWGFNDQSVKLNLTPLKGRIEVICSAANSSLITQPAITCRRDYLDPVETDVWSGPLHPLAHFAELLAAHADGSNKFVRLPYDGERAQTKFPIQLWNNSLFEGPFLKKGINKIHYELKGLQNETLALGDFEITVMDATPRKCPNAVIDLSKGSICPEAAVLCEKYFVNNNYCR